jgi:hypothetical protein
MNLLRISLAAGSVFLILQNCEPAARGAPVGYSFSGSVGFAGDTLPNPLPPPFGVFVAARVPFSGHFFYDPSTPGVRPSGPNDAMIYSQVIANGLAASLGNLTLNADSYAIEVTNDLPKTGTTAKYDTVSILFWNGLNPSPVDPIVVNGTSYSSGWFEIDFQGPSTLFSGPMLPAQLNYSDFTMTHSAFLGDENPPGGIDVTMSVTSLTAISLVPGDLNRDGKVDASDISAMMSMLAAPSKYATTHDLTNDDLLVLGDLNHSSGIDNADLQSLLNTMRGVGTVVSEPSTIDLLLPAACLAAVYHCRRAKRTCLPIRSIVQ